MYQVDQTTHREGYIKLIDKAVPGPLDDPSYIYEGDDLGHQYSPAATRFRLWAPTVGGVDVVLYNVPEGGNGSAHRLGADRGGTWSGEVAGDLRGSYYSFRLHIGDRSFEVMDPYAVGAGVNGRRALVTDLRETDPPGFRQHLRPPLARPTDAIIYEVHVRDFSVHPESGIQRKGKFLAFAETGTTGPRGVKTGVDHLAELGITHVHLLPAFDYATVDEHRPETQYNWGYDPLNFNVPEGSYATNPNGTTRIREFKEMVMALHRAGIRVVMDVVYNHTFGREHPFESIAPFYYYRKGPDGRRSNGSGTGNETASERPMMRKYILDSVRHWATEYMVDGFRFDLMALHDRETMRQVRATLDAIDPSILVYGEPWTGGETPLPWGLQMHKGAQRGMGIAVFNDHIRNAIKGDNDGTSRGFVSGGGFGMAEIERGAAGAIYLNERVQDFTQEPGETVNYVSSHDNLTLWDKLCKSNPDDDEATRIQMDVLSQAIVMTSQGIAFMAGGEELLRTKGMNPNSYNAGDLVNRIDWTRKAQYPHVFEYYRALVRLRREHPAFRLATADAVRAHLGFLSNPPAGCVAFWLRDHAGGDPWRHIIVAYNGSRQPVEFGLPLSDLWLAAPPTGTGSFMGSAKVPPISALVLYQAQ